MRAVLYVDQETGTTVGEVPDPTPGPADVIVAVEACGLCGSDVHFVQNGMCAPGQLLGHEFSGRIVALTSDATVNNMPYGASKGALDRIVIAAARELAHLGITANVINPGPVDTGWMSAEQLMSIVEASPRGRVGKPADTAALISFLCSADGGWINGQLLHSDGGLHA